MTDDEPDPGVLSLSLHRRHRDLEQENAQLTSELTELRKRLRALDTGIAIAEVTEHSKQRCHYHTRVIVDEHSPHVRCATCDTKLDPYAVLLQYAKEERRFRWSEQSLRDEKEKLAKEVEILKRQRANLRSQIRKRGGEPWEPWHKETP